MRLRRLLLLASIIGSFGWGPMPWSETVGTQSAADPNVPAPAVRLSVRVVPRVAYGGTVYAVVAIRNESAAPIWANTQIVLSGLGSAPSSGDHANLWFEVKYGGATTVAMRCSMPAVPRKFTASDYRILRVGEAIDEDIDLSCFDLSRMGQYTLVAHYRDLQRKSATPPPVVARLNYEIASAPVAFSVMGAIYTSGGQ